MTVWGISDLHLSFAQPESRERYAGRWRDHAAKIEARWREVVRPDDLVLIPGDISMARNHRDLQPDLAWLARLPGSKVLSPGNHDTWWNHVAQVRSMLRPSLHAVDGEALEIQGVLVCGARAAPASVNASMDQAQTASDRAAESLERALDQAARLRGSAQQPLYLLWHYPPFDPYGSPAPWVDRFEKAGVSVCLYGHLHTEGQWSRAVQGRRGPLRYYCVAADAVGFRPLRIDAFPRT